jgi:hypothetical protein
VRLHKTGHPIADTVSDLIGELPDGDYKIAYGILRHNIFHGSNWFEIDKGFWGAEHYNGSYRISFCGTQPRWTPDAPRKPHGLTLEPWKQQSGPALIAPPTSHVCDFFGISFRDWLAATLFNVDGPYIIRHKGDPSPIDWDSISKVITFNSTLGVEALRRGIPVISDEEHSSIGSYTKHKKALANYDRSDLYELLASHQFKLRDTEQICRVIHHYLSSSASTAAKQSQQTS